MSKRRSQDKVTATAASSRPRRTRAIHAPSATTRPTPKRLRQIDEDDGAEAAIVPAKKKSKRGNRSSAGILPSNTGAEVASEAKTTRQPGGPSETQYWLMKAEPEPRIEKGVDVSYSIDALAAAKNLEPWEGVRNYTARNNIKRMKEGDLAFFYHSNCKTPGIAGILEIASEASVDETAFDHDHPYYDPKSKQDDPKWYLVHVKFHQKFSELFPLTQLKELGASAGPLKDMQVLRQSRLSVSRVSKAEWDYILSNVVQ